MYQPRQPKLSTSCCNVYCCPHDTKATAYISLVCPHLEYAAATWDPYLVGDCKQVEKVQRRAAHFVKRDYKSTTSVSSLISQLGWQTVSDCRRNSHLSLMYKSLHGLAGISTSSFRRSSKPTRSADGDTFCVLSSQIDAYKYSFYPHTIVDCNVLLPLIHSAVRYTPAWPTPSNHTPIPAVTGGNPWPAITEEPKNHGTVIRVLSHLHHAYQFWCDSHSSFGVSWNIFFSWLIILKNIITSTQPTFLPWRWTGTRGATCWATCMTDFLPRRITIVARTGRGTEQTSSDEGLW